MKLRLISTVAVVSIFATPALAQESASFDGFNLAVLGGYESLTISDEVESESRDGAMYGLSLGYNKSVGSAVVGLEAEISDSGIKETVAAPFDDAVRATLATSRDLYIGAKVGGRLSSSVLAYAKGGYTNTRLTLDATDGVETVEFGDTLDGYRIGTGLEYSFGSFGLRAEYRYSDYGRYVYEGVKTDLSLSRHQIVAGLTARF